MSALAGARLGFATALGVAALGLAACGSDDETAQTAGAGAAGAEGPGRPVKTTIPPQIHENPQGFVSTDVVYPIENAWRAGSVNRFTEVAAGALSRDRTTGVLAIFRQDYIEVTQDTKLVEVPDAGRLRITGAPTEEGEEESAQESGIIEFEGSEGVTGTLDLSDDSIDLDGE